MRHSNHRMENDNLKNEGDGLKHIVEELVNLQKKQHAKKPKKRSGGGTKIVVLPQQSNSSKPESYHSNSVLDALRKSLM